MENNPLLCNPETGFCEIPGDLVHTQAEMNSAEKPLKLIYFTDPICSSCWAIEPQLRKLKLHYAHILDIEYRMGGLLPNWTYNSGGISKPSDVAGHWDEVSIYYDMPIDGDIWLEDPLPSSYPPSIAFKAAQIQDEEKAILFLRELREMVFMQKKNITKWEHLELAGQKVGLNIIKLKTDFEGQAKALFDEDLAFAKQNGVRGFPTIFFINKEGQKELVYGSKPYSVYENTILKLYPDATKKDYAKDWETLFSIYHSLTAKEFSELTEIPRKQSEVFLNELTEKRNLKKHTIKNGSIWLK